jgi:hypothetical protein
MSPQPRVFGPFGLPVIVSALAALALVALLLGYREAQPAGAGGSASGLATEGSQLWDQDVLNIEGVAETGDEFGGALASGDFNDDGFDDLAVGADDEEVNGAANAGAVNVVYGSADGLAADGDQIWHQDSEGVEGDAEENDDFGEALATGDFNDDGFDDLAIGAPGEDVGALNSAGAVNVLYGSESGLTADGDQIWHQAIADVEGDEEEGDEFGSALAAGNFDEESGDDLAVGVPGEAVGALDDAGAVNVLYGSETGLVVDGDQIWHQEVTDVEGEGEAGDELGAALAADDFDSDGVSDLAIGVPGEAVGALDSAGAVNVLYGLANTGLVATADQLWHQDSADIEGAAEADDRFGAALSSDDFNDDGNDDLAIGVPGQDVEALNAAGAVHVLYGSEGGGLMTGGDQVWHQGVADVEGGAEANDRFGAALAADDLNSDGFDDLAIGVPGEAVDAVNAAGAVNVLFGSSARLAADGDQIWHRDSDGVEGDPGAGENLGAGLAAGDFNDGGANDLAIGIPDADVDGLVNAGQVYILYSDAGGAPVDTATPTATEEEPAATPTATATGAAPPPTSTPPEGGLLGDVNCDGQVTAVDAALILQLVAGLVDSLPCEDAADVNQDGSVTAVDATLILQFVAGFIDTLPP